MARKPIIGYAHRYSTDGVSVYRAGKKVKPKADGFHLVKDGSTQFDVVPVDVALTGNKPVKKRKAKSGN